MKTGATVKECRCKESFRIGKRKKKKIRTAGEIFLNPDPQLGLVFQ